jgi:uncharacterized membrane protein YhaH (DUF805 family)
MGDAVTVLLAAARALFTPGGRIARRWFWVGMVLIVSLIALAEPPLAALAGPAASIALFLPCYWAAFCLMSRRVHDTGQSAGWLLILLIPLIGFAWLIVRLFFRRGDPGENQYGRNPHPAAPDYLVVSAVS